MPDQDVDLENVDVEEIARRKREEGKEKARKAREEREKEEEEARQEVKALEDDPPRRLEDWPEGRAKYETFGGPEHETHYDEAATTKLGASGVEFHEDGSVSVEGEKVDNPDEYRADEPIPNPLDTHSPAVKTREEKREELEREGLLDPAKNPLRDRGEREQEADRGEDDGEERGEEGERREG